MTRQESICVCKMFISIEIFSKDLQIPSFTIKHSSEVLRPPSPLNLDQTVVNLPSCSGVEKGKKYTLLWNQEC